MPDLQHALTELLAARRISAPTQSYAKDNPLEWQKVKAYLEGGARPSDVITHMGLGLVEVEDVRRSLVVVPPPDPEPEPEPEPVTYLKKIDDLSDCTRVWNKCNSPTAADGAQYAYIDCSVSPYSPWPRGGGIFEITTPYGPGLRCVATRDMAYNPSTQKIARYAWGDPWFTDRSYTFEGKSTVWEVPIRFPRTGNPNGFHNHHNGAVVWEMPVGPNPGEVVAIDVPSMRWRVAKHLGGSNTNYSQHLGPPMVWDEWAKLEIQKRFSRFSDGYERWYIKGELVMERTGPNLFTSENFWVLYVEFKANRETTTVDVNTAEFGPVLVREV